MCLFNNNGIYIFLHFDKYVYVFVHKPSADRRNKLSVLFTDRLFSCEFSFKTNCLGDILTKKIDSHGTLIHRVGCAGYKGGDGDVGKKKNTFVHVSEKWW